jgi:hypothetical protein
VGGAFVKGGSPDKEVEGVREDRRVEVITRTEKSSTVNQVFSRNACIAPENFTGTRMKSKTKI